MTNQPKRGSMMQRQSSQILFVIRVKRIFRSIFKVNTVSHFTEKKKLSCDYESVELTLQYQCLFNSALTLSGIHCKKIEPVSQAWFRKVKKCISYRKLTLLRLPSGVATHGVYCVPVILVWIWIFLNYWGGGGFSPPSPPGSTVPARIRKIAYQS